MKMNEKQIFARLGDVDDAFIEESALPEPIIVDKPQRRHAIAAFFEKPAVVAAACAIVALGTLAGIMMAGRAAGGPVPPISGTVSGEPSSPEQETDLSHMGNIARHDDLYYVSHGNGTCSLVGIAALPEDMVLTIPETAVNGDRVIALQDMTMTSSLSVPNGVQLFHVKGIHIPASMTSVHIKTLHKMTALESLTVDEGNPVYRAEENCLIERERERLVYAYASTVVMDAPPEQSLMALYPLTTFAIPDSVKIIATNALNDAFNPTEHVDPAYMDDALSGAIPLFMTVQIHIPASAEHIEERFFANHDYARIDLSVDGDNPVYYAEGNCLIHKASNTIILGGKKAKIPDNVTAIAPYAFSGAGLTSIHIPSSVQSIGELAFWNNPHLEEITGDPFKPTIIPDENGFYSYYFVKDNCLIYYENNITVSSLYYAKREVVLGCSNSILSEGITHIRDFAFAWNQRLTEITLPAGLQSIGFKAFAHCPNLKTIRYNSTYERWCQIDLDSTWMYENGQMTEVYFIDTDVPMTVVGVELDYTGKGETED